MSGEGDKPRSPQQRRHFPVDAPQLARGTVVWWRGEMYVVELVERQGREWVAAIVQARDAESESATSSFVPLRELEWDS